MDEIICKDGYSITKEELYKQLLKEYTGFKEGKFIMVKSLYDIEIDYPIKKDNIVYISSFKDDSHTVDALKNRRYKFIQKGDTGLPIAMHWASFMLGLPIEDVYDTSGDISPVLVMLYASFVDNLYSAGLITQEAKDDIIREVMEKGHIILPAIKTASEFLNTLRLTEQITEVSA